MKTVFISEKTLAKLKEKLITKSKKDGLGDKSSCDGVIGSDGGANGFFHIIDESVDKISPELLKYAIKERPNILKKWAIICNNGYTEYFEKKSAASTSLFYLRRWMGRNNVHFINLDAVNINENIESEVDASEINLSSFRKQDELAPKIWYGDKLNSKVRLKLLDIADDFWDFTNIGWVDRDGIYLMGSICGKNWSKFSDIDLHISVDFSKVDERIDFVQEYFDLKKNEWNNSHKNLKIYGFPVELYVEDINANTKSSGKYDLEENCWVNESDEGISIGLNKYGIKTKSANIMTKIDDLQDECDSTDDDAKLRDIGKRAKKLYRKIKRMRKFGLNRSGEGDSLNIVYKVLRRSGYLEKLWDLSSTLYDKVNSLNEAEKKHKRIIVESQETKSIAAAKKLVMQRLGYDEKKADDFVRIKLRNDLPALRTPQGGKFVLGATRMYCDGEVRTASDNSNLNSTLKLVASDAYINEYDRNLNGMSYQELVQRFAKVMSDNFEAERNEVNQMVFDTPSDYDIVRIDSFEQAQEYSQYVSWCVTHDENMFNSYTSYGINQFYFCLKNGFENVAAQPSEGCPLDEYGLSMIAVSVNENGMLNTCNCRWNRDNGGNDSIMNAKEVSQVIGMNFFEVFKPNNKWKDLLTNAMQRLSNGEDPHTIFDYVGYFYNGFAWVQLNCKWNFINQEGRIISNQWFDSLGDFHEGFAWVNLNDKYNYINQEGKLLSGQWFDSPYNFRGGFAKVELNGKTYKIDTNGNLTLIESANEDKKVLNEYHGDRRLPFEEPEYGNKMAMEEYQDWLEEFGKYGELPASTLDFWEEIEKAVRIIKNGQLKGRFDDSIPEEDSVEQIMQDLKENGMGPELHFLPNGNVYVERTVNIGYNPKSHDSDDEIFTSLVDDYNDNVGGCWSYMVDGSESYCGEYGEEIVLRGYIRTDDIDFVKTVQLNYHYEDEHEIRVKPFAKIELINFSYGRFTKNFDRHLIVSATYAGNNAKFRGEIGRVDDGFGNIQFINRKNEKVDLDEYIKNVANKVNGKSVHELMESGLFDNVFHMTSHIDDNNLTHEFYSVDLLDMHNIYDAGTKRLVLDKWYDNVSIGGMYPVDNIAIVTMGLKQTYVNLCTGQYLTNDWFDDCYAFFDVYAVVKNNGIGANFIDINGNIVLDQWYDNVSAFMDGLSVVRKNNKYNFINKETLKLMSDKWFDKCDFIGDFLYSVGMIFNGKMLYNLYSKNGLLYDKWYEQIYKKPHQFMKLKNADGSVDLANSKGEIVATNVKN